MTRRMHYFRKHVRPQMWKWREWLTQDESRTVARIERAAKPSDKMRLELQRIRNRAVQRARYYAREK